jgi:hypothetical protein
MTYATVRRKNTRSCNLAFQAIRDDEIAAE